MQKSKLLSLLKTFSREEFKEFGLFVNSPFYNREKILIKFYNALKKYYPDFNETDCDKKLIYSFLFPDKKFNDAMFRNTVSDLLKLAEKYLKQVHFEKEVFYNQYYLLKELTNRKQTILFSSNLKKSKAILKNSEVRDEIYYNYNFLLEDEIRRNHVVKSSRILFKEDNLNEQAGNLHIQHLTENIKLYAIMLNQKKFVYDHKFDFTFLELIRIYIHENYHLFSHIPYIKIYFNCVMLYKTNEKKYFDELKCEVKKNYRLLTVTDRKNMFIVMTNYCNSEIKKGKFEFYLENFNIYKDLLKTKAYLEGNNFMPHYFYQSITMNAVSAGELLWAEKFIHKYRKMLHPDFIHISYNYCLAQLYLKQKNFDNALTALSNVPAIDITYKMNINNTLLLIYFGKNETESFLSLIDSTRHFLKRNKHLKKEDIVPNNYFTIYIKRLYNLKERKDKDKSHDLILLKREIEMNNGVNYKKWFLEEINGLLAK
ncbi:MAG TPA: hypothetical protein PKD83_04410 [Ignavibacteria bacterium]|nr:hypothetical protein [Ignavibacteria bacterium]